MDTIRDIAYRPEHGRRGLLDIWLPDDDAGAPLVVVMHGGGFQALSKERMDGVACFLAREGFTAVNINYRLLPEHRFPAPIEDGLAACEWALAVGHPALQPLDRGPICIVGASAGGYIALVVGMLLGREKVRAIVDISGPVRRRQGAGGSPLSTPPLELASAEAPPVLCIHSRPDTVVPVEDSIEMVHRLESLGAGAELYLYDGPDRQHGIWREEAASPELLPHLETKIATFLRGVL